MGWMFSNPTSQKWLWVLWVVVTTGLLLAVVICNWDATVHPKSGTSESSAVMMVLAIGALGGCARWMHAPFTTNDVALPPITSCLWPFLGAILSLTITTLARAGIVAQQVNTNGTTGTNWIGLFALAALSGLFAPEAIAKLKSVLEALLGLPPANPNPPAGQNPP